jgi:hypothetical protein
MRLQHRPRQRRRRHLYYYLKVFDAQSGRLVGHLVDLSAEKMQLLIPEPVPVDAQWRLRMELPSALDGHADVVLEARSVWCRRDENPAYYGACFRLLGVSPDGRSLFESMITKFGYAG